MTAGACAMLNTHEPWGYYPSFSLENSPYKLNQFEAYLIIVLLRIVIYNSVTMQNYPAVTHQNGFGAQYQSPVRAYLVIKRPKIL